jgi:hypothetical protein
MATRKQKKELIDALKFTPRDITISLSGYGGEIVMGRITEQQYDFWQDRDDLEELVHDWDGDMDVPSDMRFITDGAWHDVDDLCHESGCEASDCCTITVYDELENCDSWESNLDISNLDSKGVDVSGHSHISPEEDQPAGTCVFMGQNFEKGTFFSGTIRITQPFDHRKLSISWIDCDGWRLINGVEYDGEEVEGYDGYSTSGKSMEFRVYQIERDGDWDPAEELAKIEVPVLEGEETWAQRVIDESSLSDWHAGDVPPVRKGVYLVEYEIGTWPWPLTAHIEWTGRRWKYDRSENTEIRRWRGLNYDPGR